MELTAEKLRELLDYDPETGVFRWKVSLSRRVKVGGIAGKINDEGYVQIKISRKEYRAHRLAWLHSYAHWPRGNLDHADGNRSNNSLRNLRECDQSQNNANAKISKRNSVGYKGVHWHNRDCVYRAVITVRGKRYELGQFKNPEDAHDAYCKAAVKHFQQFARFE